VVGAVSHFRMEERSARWRHCDRGLTLQGRGVRMSSHYYVRWRTQELCPC
jgi:hypothetical protein